MRAVKARTVHWAESTIARWTATGEATGGGSEQYGSGRWGGLLRWQKNKSIGPGPAKSLHTMSSNSFNVAGSTFSSYSKYWQSHSPSDLSPQLGHSLGDDQPRFVQIGIIADDLAGQHEHGYEEMVAR